MSLRASLATALLEHHPADAAASLERQPPPDAGRFLSTVAPAVAAQVIRRMSLARSTSLVSAMDADHVADALATLELHGAARIIRRLETSVAETLLGATSEPRRTGLRAVLRFPEATAGGLMDPEVLSLSHDVTAKDARAEIAKRASDARSTLYVTDREQLLVGVVPLRELFLAEDSVELRTLMHQDPITISAVADIAAVVAHPAWRRFHALPVVDQAGAYLGAIRYRSFRRAEDELRRRRRGDADPTRELGALFALGAGGVAATVTALGGPRDGQR